MKTKLELVNISEVICAEWNYKKPGEEEDIKKLARSISKDNSAGVFAVREVEKDGDIKLEVMDGNHRFVAVRDELKWKKVPVENFGKIDDSHAATIARRRNYNWFEDDKLKLAELMSKTVLPNSDINELLEYMPESEEDFNAYINLSNFDWQEPEEKEPSIGEGGGDKEQKQKITLFVNEEVHNLWEKWLERCQEVSELMSEERAFEFAVIEALNVPEERLKGESE